MSINLIEIQDICFEIDKPRKEWGKIRTFINPQLIAFVRQARQDRRKEFENIVELRLDGVSFWVEGTIDKWIKKLMPTMLISWNRDGIIIREEIND